MCRGFSSVPCLINNSHCPFCSSKKQSCVSLLSLSDRPDSKRTRWVSSEAMHVTLRELQRTWTWSFTSCGRLGVCLWWRITRRIPFTSFGDNSTFRYLFTNGQESFEPRALSAIQCLSLQLGWISSRSRCWIVLALRRSGSRLKRYERRSAVSSPSRLMSTKSPAKSLARRSKLGQSWNISSFDCLRKPSLLGK